MEKVAKKYLSPDKVVVDLIQAKISTNPDITHYQMPVYWTEKHKVIGDCVRLYAKDGRTIVFAPTKKECNEMVVDTRFALEAQVLHGDISQAQRESTLKGFRDGKFKVLVATDVAARGLDITGVDLVVQSEPPPDHETYVHRSGRTGRAGAKGISITLYTPRHVFWLQQITRKARVDFKILGCPQQSDLIGAAVGASVEAARAVLQSKHTIHRDWRAAARDLVSAFDNDAEKVVAACLMAANGGVTASGSMPSSLLTGQSQYVTVSVTSQRGRVFGSGQIFNQLRQHFDASVVDAVKNMRMRADQAGAVCDLPVECYAEVAALPESTGIALATTLPDIVEKADMPPPARGGAGRYSRGSGGQSNGNGRYGQRNQWNGRR